MTELEREELFKRNNKIIEIVSDKITFMSSNVKKENKDE